jgi:hypothetical protein
MKAILGFVTTALFVFTAQAQSGIALGQLVLGGSACQNFNAKPVFRGGVLRIPLSSSLTKVSGAGLERGSCAFTLPIQVAQGYRLVVNDLSAIGSVNLSPATTSKIDLEVFAAGDQGNVLSRVDGSTSKKVRKTVQLKQDGEILATGCGDSLNLRGNSAILLQGDARASANLQYVEMAFEVERCH